MQTVNVHQAKTHLSRLLAEVAKGEQVVIARSGKPIARLVPYSEAPPRVAGQDRGLIWVADDFDAPLPEEVLREFEG